jgi:hypothetical protein
VLQYVETSQGKAVSYECPHPSDPHQLSIVTWRENNSNFTESKMWNRNKKIDTLGRILKGVPPHTPESELDAARSHLSCLFILY